MPLQAVSAAAPRVTATAQTPSPEPVNRMRAYMIGAVLLVVVAMVVWGLWPKKNGDATHPPTTTEQPAGQPTVQPATKPAAEPSAATTPVRTAGTGGGVRKQALPDIPQSAINTISGTIKIIVHADVDASGKVTNAKLKSSGPSRYFAIRALKASQDWEFTPPQVNGHPCRQRMADSVPLTAGRNSGLR